MIEATAAPKGRGRRRWRLKLAMVVAASLVAGFVITRMVRENRARSVFQTSLVRASPNISRAMSLVAQTANGASLSKRDLLRVTLQTGFQRLNDVSMLQLVHLRAELARRGNRDICAALWSGGRNQDVIPEIESLPSDQQQAWVRVFDDAALATIANDAVRAASPPSEVAAAMKHLISSMSPDDGHELQRLMIQPASVSRDDACTGARLFYETLQHLDQADQIIIARSLLDQK